MMEINKEIIYIEKTDTMLILKTRLSENLIKLTKVEFEIIAYYSRVLNKEKVILFYENKLNIERMYRPTNEMNNKHII